MVFFLQIICWRSLLIFIHPPTQKPTGWHPLSFFRTRTEGWRVSPQTFHTLCLAEGQSSTDTANEIVLKQRKNSHVMHISSDTNSRAKELGESHDAQHETAHHVRNPNQTIVTPHRSKQLRNGTGEPRDAQPTLHITIETLTRPMPTALVRVQ